MVGHRVISLVTVAVFARAAVAQVPLAPTPVPEATATPISGLYLDPSIWAAVPGPSLGLQIALGLLWLLDGWGAGKVDIFAAVACAASKSPGGGECP